VVSSVFVSFVNAVHASRHAPNYWVVLQFEPYSREFEHLPMGLVELEESVVEVLIIHDLVEAV
jgi:hypothetical protein